MQSRSSPHSPLHPYKMDLIPVKQWLWGVFASRHSKYCHSVFQNKWCCSKKRQLRKKKEKEKNAASESLHTVRNTASITAGSQTELDGLVMSIISILFYGKLYIGAIHPRRWQLTVAWVLTKHWSQAGLEVQLMTQLILLHTPDGKDHDGWSFRLKLTFSSCWVWTHAFPFLIDAYAVETPQEGFSAAPLHGCRESLPPPQYRLFVEGCGMTERYLRFYCKIQIKSS